MGALCAHLTGEEAVLRHHRVSVMLKPGAVVRFSVKTLCFGDMLTIVVGFCTRIGLFLTCSKTLLHVYAFDLLLQSFWNLLRHPFPIYPSP